MFCYASTKRIVKTKLILARPSTSTFALAFIVQRNKHENSLATDIIYLTAFSDIDTKC